MKLFLFCLILLVFFVLTLTADDKDTFLALPIPRLCDSRPKHWTLGKSTYFYSAHPSGFRALLDPKENEGPKLNWLYARNVCRRRCMDLISIETEPEFIMIKNLLSKNNISAIWTSGRLCDFDGCNSTSLFPLNVNGWFWSATRISMPPTNATPTSWSQNPWSDTGYSYRPQPDNLEFSVDGIPESCMAVYNNLFKDGIRFHDSACYHEYKFVCEENEELIQYVEYLKQSGHAS